MTALNSINTGLAAGLLILAAALLLSGCHRTAASRQPLNFERGETPRCDPQFLQIIDDARAPHTGAAGAPRAERERAMEKTHLTARVRAENWLQLVEYRPASTRSAPAMALLSFPQATTSLARRSYLYDNALALLWFSWNGQYSRAQGLAQTLGSLQLADGSWGYSFHLDNPDDLQARYIRSGAVAWAAHAMAYFGAQFGEPAALLSAQRAARFLTSMRLDEDGPTRGLISAGRGRPSTRLDAPPSPKLMFAVSEHQFDAQLVLARFFPAQARRLAEQMLDTLWLSPPGRFAVAAGEERVDTRRALDAAGAWGALWLLGAGHPELARESFTYARDTFASSTHLAARPAGGAPIKLKIEGFRPYEDAIDDYDVEAAPGHIFVEGSMGMGLAAHRLGDPETAQSMLQTGIALSCAGPPGIPYSTVELPGFSTHAAAAPTLWFLFLDREMATGRSAPIFDLLDTPSLTF